MAKVTGCTNARMPDECPSMRACLTAAQIATITSWINAGAPMCRRSVRGASIGAATCSRQVAAVAILIEPSPQISAAPG